MALVSASSPTTCLTPRRRSSLPTKQLQAKRKNFRASQRSTHPASAWRWSISASSPGPDCLLD
jgi:hypothetical protein